MEFREFIEKITKECNFFKNPKQSEEKTDPNRTWIKTETLKDILADANRHYRFFCEGDSVKCCFMMLQFKSSKNLNGLNPIWTISGKKSGSIGERWYSILAENLKKSGYTFYKEKEDTALLVNVFDCSLNEIEVAVEKLKEFHNKINGHKDQIIQHLKEIQNMCKSDEWKPILEMKKNLILQGAPGTGKTYSTAELALNILGYNNGCKYQTKKDPKTEITVSYSDRKSVMGVYNDLLIKNYVKYDSTNKDDFGKVGDKGQIAFVTFHQSMDYEDFIEGIKPVSINDGKDVAYPVKTGIFKAIANKAKEAYDNWKNENKDSEPTKYVLIIDEINRGNVSKIFGELITLLEADKRHGEENAIPVTLPYSQEEFSVPSNLYIIGTMNTTDRSAGSLDYAIRRRFAFVTLESSDTEISEGNPKKLYNAVKKFIEDQKAESDMDLGDLMIGHSYFMGLKKEDSLQMKWKYEILPLLMEYYKDGLLKMSPLTKGKEKEQKEDFNKWIEVQTKSPTGNPGSSTEIVDETKNAKNDQEK